MQNFRQQLLKDALGDNNDFVTHLSDILNILPETKQLQKEAVAFFSLAQLQVPEWNSETLPYVDYRFEKLLLNNYRKFDKPIGKVRYFLFALRLSRKSNGELIFIRR